MSSTCSTGACAPSAGSSAGCCPSGSCCSTGGACSASGACSKGAGDCLSSIQCPIEGATQMWSQSFGDAMRQAQTEVLKSKILKAWGPMLDEAADGLIETMGAVWQVKLAEVRVGAAKQAFQERLRDLWLQEPKKK
jgi:hypothetical protein